MRTVRGRLADSLVPRKIPQVNADNQVDAETRRRESFSILRVLYLRFRVNCRTPMALMQAFQREGARGA